MQSKIFRILVCLLSPALLTGSVRSVDGPEDWNVLLITVDTLRADRLGVYGYEKGATENFARVAADGAVFEQVVSAVPLTLPSHASIFTGSYPIAHGVRDNAGFVVSQEQATLAELLKAGGFATGAFVGSFVLDSRFGLDQGFDRYYSDFDLTGLDTIAPGYIQRPAEQVAREAEKWMRAQLERKQRFFAWMHFYDPHAPYEPPRPWSERYRDLYDGEIAYVDSTLGQVLDFLKKTGLDASTMVILTSDHGEALGQHGEATHGYFIYEETQRVPLIWATPDRRFAGRRIAQTVRLIDLAPTLLQLLRIPAPDAMQGNSLLRLMLGRPGPHSEAYAESYYPRLQFGWSQLRSFYRRPYKYIEAPQPELYNLEKDPAEQTNLFAGNQSLANSMRAELFKLIDRFSAATAAADAGQLDSETLEALGSLGYITLSAGTRQLDRDYLQLPDPKQKIGLYNRMTDTYTLIRAGRYDEAARSFRKILSEDPHADFVYHPLGQVYAKMRRYEDAVEVYRKAEKAFPGDSLLHFNLGNALLRLRRWKEAGEAFRATLKIDPSHFRARNNLATLWLQQGRYKESLEASQTILEKHPRYEPALFNAGLSLLAQGSADGAIEYLQRAVEVNPRNADAYQYLGQAYEAKGEPAEAQRCFGRAKALRGSPRR